MYFQLTDVSGIPEAITALTMSKRHFDSCKYHQLKKDIRDITTFTGAFLDVTDFASNLGLNSSEAERRIKVREEIIDKMNKVAKYGAGVGGDAWLDDGHDTLLRFIDVTFITVGLHRAAQDDLDAHAKRFDSRIVRESTRLAQFGDGERSEWYSTRIRSIEDMLKATTTVELPDEYTDEEGVRWVKSAFGYIRADLVHSPEVKDVKRGLYPESIPSNAIWKINLYDLRHVYKRRNKFTHASPELKMGIEDLADQYERAIPGDLGKLVRYDYVLDPVSHQFKMAHVMDIRKVYDPRSAYQAGGDHE